MAGLESPDDDDRVVGLDVWFAGEPAQWHQGLQAVTDLGGADGMLFVFDSAAEHRFYMWQTPMPLDIYFFDAERHFVDADDDGAVPGSVVTAVRAILAGRAVPARARGSGRGVGRDRDRRDLDAVVRDPGPGHVATADAVV